VALLEITDQELVDAARGRKVLTRVYAPADPGRYPTIIFSHGFSSDLGAFENTVRLWAQHGHVVLHPTHADSLAYPDPIVDPREAETVRRVIAGRATGVDAETRRAFVRVMDNPFYLEHRLADVAFLLRSLRDGNSLDERVVARVDMSRLGMAGHSYGAYTTLVIAGAKLERDSAALKDPLLRGFKAAIAISGQGSGRLFFADRSFASISMPLFMITGTNDMGAADETPTWRHQAFRESPPRFKYSAVLDGFGHREFDPPADDPVRGATGETLRAMQLEFWGAFLCDRAEARDALAARAAGPQEGGAIAFEAR
jgi:pimeloyl-ACP methyl ester carboxylesterase